MSVIFAVAALTGCLDPSRDVGLYSSYVLPANYRVPRLDDDTAETKKLDANDGFGTSIPLHSGFALGHEVLYWDLGNLTATTLRPMYIFRRREVGSEILQDASHPDLIDSIPGDTAYSPLRQVYIVYVTPDYNGERITSLRALEDAVELGLVLSPRPFQYFVNCVVTLASTQLQTSEDGTQVAAPRDAYYRGQVVKQFCIGDLVADVGAIMLTDNNFTPGNAYILRRQNENQPLDEAALKQDLNSDGDQIDSNVIFDTDVQLDGYSGIWRAFDVVVSRDFKLGDAKNESDLFERSGNTLSAKPTVVEFSDKGVFLNRPIRLAQ